MAVKFQYNKIIKYLITAVCVQPLHIGSAIGEKEEVLIHPVDNMPFIQATSIIGVFREYITQNHKDVVKELFGASNEKEDNNSKLKISDGRFVNNTVKLEFRPRVKIDCKTGSVSSNKTGGSGKKSGQKFNTEYVATGAEFEFEVYLYDEKFKEDLENIFVALNSESIQLGGQKSSGSGQIELKELLVKEFDMTNEKDRNLWIGENFLPKSDYKNILEDLKKKENKDIAYEFVVEGQTEGEILVKGVSVGSDEESPDNTNIQNASGEFIIPGTSFRGVIRSQMERIAKYLDNNTVIDNTFGKRAEKENVKIGNTIFCDTIIKEGRPKKSHRIHIDKFTGGVMNTSLFTEESVSGSLKFQINIKNKNEAKETSGILIMALRDLSSGLVNLGSGYSVGRGFVKVSKIIVKDRINNSEAVIDFEKAQINDKSGIISECLKAVQKR